MDFKTVRKDLKKRARNKYITCNISLKLVDHVKKLDLDRDKMQKSYWLSWHCCGTLEQKKDKLIGHYCNARWCTVCNRIRTANLMNGYLPVIKGIKEKEFVTLTVPNCTGEELAGKIREMLANFNLIRKQLVRIGIKLKGIRKLEVTYNPDRENFHPHFHFIIAGGMGSVLRKYWLYYNNKHVSRDIIDSIDSLIQSRIERGANKKKYIYLNEVDEMERAKFIVDPQFQDCCIADDNSVKELFKYFTKIVSKSKIKIAALDTIFRAMRGKKVFQPFGIKKLKVSENVEEIKAEIITDLGERVTNWEWYESDWLEKDSGECLSGYTPSDNVEKLLKNIT